VQETALLHSAANLGLADGFDGACHGRGDRNVDQSRKSVLERQGGETSQFSLEINDGRMPFNRPSPITRGYFTT
jgi:hypothetical protein